MAFCGDQNQGCFMIKRLLMICASEQYLFKLADFNAYVIFFIFLPLIML